MKTSLLSHAKINANLFIFLFFFTTALPVWAIKPVQIVEKIALQLKWSDQFQFAGYYAAKEKGFYAEEGLDVQFKQRIPYGNTTAQVLNGEADYGVGDCGLLLDRLRGKPVVVLASIFQHNALVYISLKSSGIVSPYEFKGKRIMDESHSIASVDAPLQAMLYELGISTHDYIHLNHSYNLDDLVDDKTDVMPAYLTEASYYFQQKHNVEINIIDPRNYGIDFLGDNLFTTEQEIRQHPERVRKFLRASLKGWDYALKNPEEIITLILNHYNQKRQLNYERLRFEAQQTQKMIEPDLIPIGSTSSKRFEHIAQTYQQLGMVKSLNGLEGFVYQHAEQNLILFSPAEKVWLQTHPVISLGIHADFPPYEWIDDDGNYQGLSADYVSLIEQRLGVKIKLIANKPWTEILEMARRGEIDMLADIKQTPEREQYLSFVEPYIETPTIIITHEKNGFIGNLSRLKGKKVAVEEGYFMQQWLQKNHPEIALMLAKNTYDALVMVNNGQAAAYIGDATAADYAIRKHGLINLRFSGNTDEKSGHRMAATQNNLLLKDILSKSLKSIPDGEKQALLNRWLGLKIDSGVKTDTLIHYGVAVFVLFLLTALWNMRLQREIGQRKLRESENAFKHLFEDSADPILLVKEGRLIDCNAATLKLLKYGVKEKLLNYRLSDISPQHQTDGSSSVSKANDMMTIAIQKGYHRFEWQYIRADGLAIPVEVSLTPMTIHGEPIVYVCWRDITERKKIEDALRKSEERYERAVNGSHDGIWEWNLTTGEDYLSPQWKRLLGYEDYELPNTQSSFFNQIHPEDYQRVLTAKSEHFQNYKSYEIELRLRCKNGDYRWFYSRGQTIRDAEGKPLCQSGSITDITARKLAEAALRESEEQLQLVLEGGHLGFWDWNILKSDVQRNEIWAKMLGYSLEEIQTTVKQWSDFIHPEDREKAWQSINDVLTGKKSYHELEYRMLHKDGSIRWILDHASVVRRDAIGNPLRMSGTHTDITKLKEIETAFKESNERLQKIASRLPGMVYQFHGTSDGVYSFPYCSDGVHAIFKVSAEQACDNSACVFSRIHPDDYDGFVEAVNKSQQQLTICQNELRVCFEDGSIRWIHTNSIPQRLEDGSTLWHGFASDITDRKQTEQALLESEFRWKFAIEGSGDGVWDWNIQTNEVQYSIRWKEMLGYSDHDILPTNNEWETRIHPDDRDYVARTMQNYLIGNTNTYVVEHRLKCKDGRYKWILGRGAIVSSSEDGKPLRMIGTHTDITKLREAELKANLANQAKSEFLANMSHEIRTPMNGIIGMAELALRTQLTPKQANYLNKIIYASQSLLSIINDILDFSRIEAGKLELEEEVFSLDELLLYVDDMITIKAKEKNIPVTAIVSADTPKWLMGDTLRLGQILLNLVSNAVKFTEQGSIIISVKPLEQLADTVRLCFQVQDSGIGMTPEQLEKLFQPFSQADSSITRKYGGAGLGLVISKKLLELMKGEIRVESQQNQGSLFTFTLSLKVAKEPLNSGSTLSEQDHAEALSRIKGYKVLLVEDNEINQEVAIELLTHLGCIVETVNNGYEAVREVFSGKFDLALMDIQMPEMDGLTATRLIRANEKFATFPIIAMTANAMTGDKENGLTAGMNDYLTKPIDSQKLAAVLNRWLTHLTPQEHRPMPTQTITTHSHLPETLPPFDLTIALLRVNNNRKLLRKLLLMFRDDYRDAMAKLTQLLSTEDYAEAKIMVHTLKGVAGNLQAVELAAAAAELENAIVEKRADLSTWVAKLEIALTAAWQATHSLE